MARKELGLFLAGFVSCAFLFYLSLHVGQEVPLISGMSVLNNISPGDWIKNKDIAVYEDRIIIKISNASISNYAATGSMRPLLDYNSNGIRIKPSDENSIEVGDIVSFRRDGMMIVHRVVDTGLDENGKFFVTKGDNASLEDGKIRFSDIEFVTIGILW